MSKFFARTSLTGRLAVLSLLVASGTAGAQVYRIVGPDGKVTFSDKPPLETTTRATPARVTPGAGGPGDSQPAEANLPFELRDPTSRYPATLYTGPNCPSCMSGRTYLISRGIPFTEKTISTAEDIAAYSRLTGGATTLPLLTLGTQQVNGYSQQEWSQYLDAAGYPGTSRLPNYRPAPPTALAVPRAPAPATNAAASAAAAARAAAPAPAAPAAPPGSNPAGITF